MPVRQFHRSQARDDANFDKNGTIEMDGGGKQTQVVS